MNNCSIFFCRLLSLHSSHFTFRAEFIGLAVAFAVFTHSICPQQPSHKTVSNALAKLKKNSLCKVISAPFGELGACRYAPVPFNARREVKREETNRPVPVLCVVWQFEFNSQLFKLDDARRNRPSVEASKRIKIDCIDEARQGNRLSGFAEYFPGEFAVSNGAFFQVVVCFPTSIESANEGSCRKGKINCLFFIYLHIYIHIGKYYYIYYCNLLNKIYLISNQASCSDVYNYMTRVNTMETVGETISHTAPSSSW